MRSHHHVSPVLELCKIQLRHKLARLLGYICYFAGYATDVRMPSSSRFFLYWICHGC
nr:probable thimet oligopeptidase [Ipomoea batatas]